VNEEPIISRGVVKVALIVLVAGALGVGGFALAGGGIDLPDLPDLPEVDTLGESTNLENTNLENTTVGDDLQEPADPFSSASFADAKAKVVGEVGAGQEVTRLFVNEVQTQFIVRRGDGVEAYSVRADSGELSREDATITFSGNATISDFAFPIDSLDPAAIDRMLSSARSMSGAGDFAPTVLNLERQIPFGSRKLQWTISAEGGGRNLTYKAKADGSDVTDIGGEGTAIPPEAQEAGQLAECIEKAGNDPDEIFACLDKFQ